MFGMSEMVEKVVCAAIGVAIGAMGMWLGKKLFNSDESETETTSETTTAERTTEGKSNKKSKKQEPAPSGAEATATA